MISKISASAIYSILGNSSSLVPMGIKDVANSCGLTTASYLAGDKEEGKDRFIDEFGTQAIWLFGIPAYKYILDKTLFKASKLDSGIDVRILKNKDIFNLAHEFAPNQKIAQNIIKAGKNQKLFKGLTLGKFVISTGLTALTYLKLTKFRHKYIENRIKKDYYTKNNLNQQYTSNNIPFSSAFSSVHNTKKDVSFTGGLHDFMFDPVKNMMLLDMVITGERFKHSRNPQDFMGYVVKEGSYWVFMYAAGKMISNALEKHTEKKYAKSIELDARVIENDSFKQSFKDGSIKEHLASFKSAFGSDAEIYKFSVNPKTDNLVVEMAKKSDIISMFKVPKINIPVLKDIFTTKTTVVDTRKYIDINDLKGIADKIEKLYNQYEQSGEDIDSFFKSLRTLKRSAILKNIGACIGALGVIAPAIMLALRHFGDNKEYQVKRDIETKLKNTTA